MLRTSNGIYRDFMKMEFPYRMLREAKQAATLIYKLGNPKKDVVFLVDVSDGMTEIDVVKTALLTVVEKSGSIYEWDR